MAAGQGAVYLDGGFRVEGGSSLYGAPIVFGHGDTVQFNGWTDSHRDGAYGIGDTSNATFTIDIVGPNKEIVYHTVVNTDEAGNAYFELTIPEDFAFGTYTVLYSLEKEGFIGVTPNSTSPNVSYYESKFYVTWKQDDIINSNYELELVSLQSTTILYGSSIDMQGYLCPSPKMRNDAHEALFDPLTGSTVLAEPDAPVIIGHFYPPPNASKLGAFDAARNVTAVLSDDMCSKAFTFESGVIGLSGNWSVSADAYWMVENDTTHVYHAQTNKTAAFVVAEPQYTSDNIMTVKLDEQFQHTTPLDWSPDGKSILFRYYDEPAQKPKLGILHLASNSVTALDPLSSFPRNMTELITTYDAQFSTSNDTIIVGVLDRVYRYDIRNATLHQLFDYEPIGFIDVNTDGSILVNINGTMLVTDSEGNNAKVVLRAGENPNTGYGDLSPDGKKLLYRKVQDSGYGWSEGSLAYYDIETKKETVIPNVSIGCGYAPKWAPNGFHIMFHESSCTRGWPGAILRITDINGSFQEYIVPASNDYPLPGIFSPDGSAILIAFDSSGTIDGAAENMGGPANFYIMTLATPMPEFGSPLAMGILLCAFVGTIILAAKFNLHGGLK